MKSHSQFHARFQQNTFPISLILICRHHFEAIEKQTNGTLTDLSVCTSYYPILYACLNLNNSGQSIAINMPRTISPSCGYKSPVHNRVRKLVHMLAKLLLRVSGQMQVWLERVGGDLKLFLVRGISSIFNTFPWSFSPSLYKSSRVPWCIQPVKLPLCTGIDRSA